jgi:hypothetical protein
MLFSTFRAKSPAPPPALVRVTFRVASLNFFLIKWERRCNNASSNFDDINGVECNDATNANECYYDNASDIRDDGKGCE